MRVLEVCAFAVVLVTAAAEFQCPGSKSWVHANCRVTAHLAEDCAAVGAEVRARIAGLGGWVDPHNHGQYALVGVKDDASVILATHTTGAAPHYLDKLSLVLTAEGTGCRVDACSESQVFSILDFSTNYCNLRNLYCGSAEECGAATFDLTVATEDFSQGCWQRSKEKCFIPAK